MRTDQPETQKANENAISRLETSGTTIREMKSIVVVIHCGPKKNFTIFTVAIIMSNVNQFSYFWQTIHYKKLQQENS